MTEKSSIMTTPDASQNTKPRVRVFVDYWNIQLTLNEKEARETGEEDPRFAVKWGEFGALVARKAAEITGVDDFAYDGSIIYTSYNPKGDSRYKNWVSNWLDRQSGIQVVALERQPKALPRCPACHKVIEDCPFCKNRITAMTEKGVDTYIATDMIRLAWEDAYDIAVLCTLDADLVPAVKFLDQKGRKVVQAGFPPGGRQLSTACWASLDLFSMREEYRRLTS